LNVDAVVTGSVLFSTNHVRITVRLVEMPTERDVWAQSYEGDFEHPLQTQSEIARSITEQLRGILDQQEEAGLKKPAGEDPVARDPD
jgi:TolB-like protein